MKYALFFCKEKNRNEDINSIFEKQRKKKIYINAFYIVFA